MANFLGIFNQSLVIILSKKKKMAMMGLYGLCCFDGLCFAVRDDSGEHKLKSLLSFKYFQYEPRGLDLPLWDLKVQRRL